MSDNEIQELYCVGLTFDYGVGMTALDAEKRCFKTTIIQDACSSINSSSDVEMRSILKSIGVNFINSDDLKSTI